MGKILPFVYIESTTTLRYLARKGAIDINPGDNFYREEIWLDSANPQLIYEYERTDPTVDDGFQIEYLQKGTNDAVILFDSSNSRFEENEFFQIDLAGQITARFPIGNIEPSLGGFVDISRGWAFVDEDFGAVGFKNYIDFQLVGTTTNTPSLPNYDPDPRQTVAPSTDLQRGLRVNSTQILGYVSETGQYLAFPSAIAGVPSANQIFSFRTHDAIYYNHPFFYVVNDKPNVGSTTSKTIELRSYELAITTSPDAADYTLISTENIEMPGFADPDLIIIGVIIGK